MVLVVAGRAVQRLEASARLGTSERTVERVDRGRCGRGGAGVFAEGRVHLLQGWQALQMETETESARAELITTCLVVPWCRARGRDENMRTMTGYKGVGPGPGEAMGRRRGPRAMTKGSQSQWATHIPTFQSPNVDPLSGLDDTNGSRPGTGALRRVRRVCPGGKSASLRLDRRSTNCFRSPRPPFRPFTLGGTPPLSSSGRRRL